MKYLPLIGIFLSFMPFARAQKASGAPTTFLQQSTALPYAQQLRVHSTILGSDRKINIFLPESFTVDSDEHTYPVLLLLEDEFFLMVSGVVKHLSSVDRMPNTIVVSLVEGPDIPKLYTNNSDFWPKDWKQLPFGTDPDPFTRHLQEELFPFLQERFRANNFRMVMGLSGTAAYVLHAFVKAPALFAAHIGIASGDLLGMGYAENDRFIDRIDSILQHMPQQKGYLYLTSADADTENYPMIRANLEELQQRLDQHRFDNFRFAAKVFQHEGHYDVALPALSEALELIFPKAKWSAKYRDIIGTDGDAMIKLDEHYRALSETYGFQVRPRADRWNSINRLSWIGPYLLREGRIAEAIDVMKRWSQYRPKSIEAREELARAYEANTAYAEAKAALESAYEIAFGLKLEEKLDNLSEKIRLLENELNKRE